jgi:hypothetical protein
MCIRDRSRVAPIDVDRIAERIIADLEQPSLSDDGRLGSLAHTSYNSSNPDREEKSEEKSIENDIEEQNSLSSLDLSIHSNNSNYSVTTSYVDYLLNKFSSYQEESSNSEF